MANSERMFVVLNEQFSPPKEFTEMRLKFSIPADTTEHGKNTLVTISGVPGKGYYGDVDVYYDRMDLVDYVEEFDFRSLATLDRTSIVTALANFFQLEIDPDDVVDFEPPVLADGETIAMTLTAVPSSLQWKGQVDISVSFGKAWLDMVIGRRNLNVYVIPNAANSKVNGRMSTWGADFSGVQFALKPDAKGDYTDWDTVQSVTRLLGIPDWLKGKVVDKATADVPDANPAFQRVVIQQSVVSGLLVGPLYFHYNPA